MTATSPEADLVPTVQAAATCERRRKILRWLALESTQGRTVIPGEVIDTLLDVCACPSLTGEARSEVWDEVLNWTDLQEEMAERRGSPCDVDESCTGPWAWEDAERIARQRLDAALARLTERGAPSHGRANAHCLLPDQEPGVPA